jgi:hypothetical protein
MDEQKTTTTQQGNAPVQPPAKDAAPAQPARGKTTPDEGKTFKENTLFLCVQDCWQNNTRYRRGDELSGRTCPPFFVVKPDPEDK